MWAQKRRLQEQCSVGRARVTVNVKHGDLNLLFNDPETQMRVTVVAFP